MLVSFSSIMKFSPVWQPLWNFPRTAIYAHSKLPESPFLSLWLSLYTGFFWPLFLFITSHTLSTCMVCNALNASSRLLGGGYGIGEELAETASLLAWLTYLLPWQQAQQHKPAVKAVTVRSVLTSACHFSLKTVRCSQNWSQFVLFEVPLPGLSFFCLCVLKIKLIWSLLLVLSKQRQEGLKQNDLSVRESLTFENGFACL